MLPVTAYDCCVCLHTFLGRPTHQYPFSTSPLNKITASDFLGVRSRCAPTLSGTFSPVRRLGEAKTHRARLKKKQAAEIKRIWRDTRASGSR